MIDCYTATVQDLQVALENNEITSVEIVEQCLAQIHTHNTTGRNLRAIISAPSFAKATAIAAVLDNERRNGITRSPLHGIPIIIKDNILTSSELDMDTTGGSVSLVGAKSSRNASMVDRLLQAGMIVIGKANLTEFAGLKTERMTPGWSSLGGQTQSPFVEGGLRYSEGVIGHTSPAGSSSGSAVGVAAGFSPLAIGTETIGSAILPATRAGIYCFRAGFGTVPMDGVIHLSPDIDMIGTFGRCPKDLADLSSYLLDRPGLLSIRPGVVQGKKQLSVAFTDPKVWQFNEELCKSADPESIKYQTVTAYELAIKQLSSEMSTTYPVELPDVSSTSYKEDGKDYGIVSISYHQIRDELNTFLTQAYDFTPVRSLAEMIAWNARNPDLAFHALACPDQSQLETVQASASSPELIARVLAHVRQSGQAGLDAVFNGPTGTEEGKVDLIAAPADSAIAILAAAAGYPAAVCPFPTLLEFEHVKDEGVAEDGANENVGGKEEVDGVKLARPFGLALIGRPGQEEDLFRFMNVWERVVCPPSLRPVPAWVKARA